MSNIQENAHNFIDALHALETQTGDSEAQIAAIVALFSTQTEITNAALQLSGKSENGHDGACRFWSEYKSALGECVSKFHHVTSDENAAGLFWTTEGISLAGQNVKYDGVSLLEFDDDGLITFFRGYYDTRDLTVKAPLSS